MNFNSSIFNKFDNNSDGGIDYTLRFSPISNDIGYVSFIDHLRNLEQEIEIIIEDEDFGKYRTQKEYPSLIADLVDLAVAIYASDRLSPQNLSKKQRCIEVFLPVRHPELLNKSSFYSKLKDLLYWLTDSKWIFNFQKRFTEQRLVERQTVLPLVYTEHEVALWSGGLDAFAGLYNRLRCYPNKLFALFGTGSNTQIYARQKRVADTIESIFPDRTTLYRLPIRFSNSNNYQKNKLSRARGAVFCLLGVACSYLVGERSLSIYENGTGAINLPYTKAAVGLDHSRSVHPITLLRISELVSELLGEKFIVQNPFLFWTKAQMCQVLAKDNRSNLSTLTISCDSPHRKEYIQCGYCSSCLLRRQALAAANIKDKSRYVLLHGEHSPRKPDKHFYAMKAQVSTLSDLLSVSDDPNIKWESLTKEFLELDDVVDQCSSFQGLTPIEMKSRLIQLYQSYVSEWETAESQLAIGITSPYASTQQPLTQALATTSPEEQRNG